VAKRERGSTPAGASSLRSSADRAAGFYPAGRAFKSSRGHHVPLGIRQRDVTAAWRPPTPLVRVQILALVPTKRSGRLDSCTLRQSLAGAHPRSSPPGGQIFAIMNRDPLSRVIMAAGGSAVSIEEESMKRHWPILGLLVLALAIIDASFASAKQRHRGARHAARHAPVNVAPPSSFEPARMIEVRPGVWISTYDCITDDGYGRWRPCSSTSRSGG
jgi:hypothetical protein